MSVARSELRRLSTSDHALPVQHIDLPCRVTELEQHLFGVLTEPRRRAGGHGTDAVEVERAADDAEIRDVGMWEVYEHAECRQLVVLDEINYTISYKMLDPAEVSEALKNRPERVHVICTGRNAHPQITQLADLVTEMREVKHPYTKGILAQRGIDY